ncbi:ABC transporter permease [Advenella alkanexedens]|uniref:ABC transporter permease n=1 Tax=Advenella alkanexedens TaxID=1481665 RepID=UPI00267765E8|nr:ABC transporter permease subunit [Advenella alkanexedens]WKU19872.1 ABC transporter permease subunit [Advenella alkanexedens]
MLLITILYLVFLFTPIALLLIGAFGESWSNTILPVGFTWQWFEQLASDPSFRRAFWTSIKVVLATCVLNILIGVPLAYAIYASARRGVQLAAKIMALLPIAVPDLVLGFGFILVFSSDTLPWLGSIWLLIAAHTILTIPYTVNTVLADMQQQRLDSYEQVAATLSAGFWTRQKDIVLPLIGTSIFSSLLMVAALSIGEFQISNLIAGFLSRTYPVVLLQAFYGATGFACAATVVLLFLAILASLGSTATSTLTKRG